MSTGSVSCLTSLSIIYTDNEGEKVLANVNTGLKDFRLNYKKKKKKNKKGKKEYKKKKKKKKKKSYETGHKKIDYKVSIAEFYG